MLPPSSGLAQRPSATDACRNAIHSLFADLAGRIGILRPDVLAAQLYTLYNGVDTVLSGPTIGRHPRRGNYVARRGLLPRNRVTAPLRSPCYGFKWLMGYVLDDQELDDSPLLGITLGSHGNALRMTESAVFE